MKERQVNGNMTRNMDIDERIAYERKWAEKNRQIINSDSVDSVDDEINMNCLKCAEEHEQLAEWLEELKKIKSRKENYYDGFKEGKQVGYDKAIDDFKSEVKDLINNSTVIRHKDVDEIAEQLKAGGENE